MRLKHGVFDASDLHSHDAALAHDHRHMLLSGTVARIGNEFLHGFTAAHDLHAAALDIGYHIAAMAAYKEFEIH